MSSPSASHQELQSDCTCPVCQEVFVNPQRLRCRHTLCRKCVHKMTQESAEDPHMEMINPFDILGLFGQMSADHKPSKTKRTLRCPICREESDRCEPDEAAEQLVQVLRLLRDTRCRHPAEDCWAEATISCPCCDKRYCPKHYEQQLTAVKEAADSLCQGIRALLSPGGDHNAEDLRQLQSAVDKTAELEAVLTERLQRGLADFRQQALVSRAELETPAVEAADTCAALEGDLEAATRLLSHDNLPGLARLLPKAIERLRAAQRAHPPRMLALQFQPERLAADLDSLMLRASASTYRSPYAQLPPVLSRVHARNLTQKPWDICILTNLEGVTCINGSLKLVSDLSSSCGSKLTGPLLVINAQSFPTKMLHVTDMDVQQVATITPRFGSEGMPGRMHVCNERQLILTSDAGRHKVSVFTLEGELQVSFGEKGSGPRQFHAPLGLCASHGQMMVVDSKNKRIQVFDMDNDYACLTTLECSGFSDGISSVMANADTIFVVDRDASRMFAFDWETRAAVSQLTLDGKPFDVVPDEFGNAMVTLVDEAKVQIVHRFGALKTVVLKETHENQDPPNMERLFPLMQMPSIVPRRMFHGAAYEQTKRRLFVADLMRSCIVVAELG